MNELNPGKEYSRFGWQIGLILAAKVFTLLLGFIRLPVLTKGLGAGLYGTWSLLESTISLIVPFALIGLHMGIVRFLSAEKDESRIRDDFFSVFSVVFMLGAVLAALLILFSDQMALYVFKDIEVSRYIKLASVLILLNASLTLSLSFFQAFRKIGLYTSIGLLQGTLQVGLMALFISLGYDLGGVVAAFVISAVFFNLTALAIILKQRGFQVPRFTRIDEFLRFSLPLTPNVAIMCYFLNTSSAGVMLEE